jgi:hypothetical protein
MIRQNIFTAVVAPCIGGIFFLCHHKFRIDCTWVTGITRNQISLPRFFGIFSVIGTLGDGLGDSFAFVDMERLYPCSSQEICLP